MTCPTKQVVYSEPRPALTSKPLFFCSLHFYFFKPVVKCHIITIQWLSGFRARSFSCETMSIVHTLENSDFQTFSLMAAY